MTGHDWLGIAWFLLTWVAVSVLFGVVWAITFWHDEKEDEHGME